MTRGGAGRNAAAVRRAKFWQRRSSGAAARTVCCRAAHEMRDPRLVSEASMLYIDIPTAAVVGTEEERHNTTPARSLAGGLKIFQLLQKRKSSFYCYFCTDKTNASDPLLLLSHLLKRKKNTHPKSFFDDLKILISPSCWKRSSKT
jgi:hypothetical protein